MPRPTPRHPPVTIDGLARVVERVPRRVVAHAVTVPDRPSGTLGLVIRSEVRDHVAEVVIDNPPVNALPVKGWFELADTIRGRTAATTQVRALIVSANPELRGFQAGRRHQGARRRPDEAVARST